MNPGTPLAQRITLRHLRLAWVVGQELNLSRAARRLHTTQPAISAALRDLEELLQARLFERTTRKVALTPLGRRFCEHADRVLGEMERAALAFEAERSGQTGELRVGLIPQVPSSLLAGAIRQLGPCSTRVHVIEGAAQSLIHSLALGHIDLLVSHLSAGAVGTPLHIEALYEDTTCLAVAPGHALASRKRLRWDDVRPLRWVLPPADAPVRHRIEREMLLRGVPDLKDAIEVASQSAMLQMLEASGGVAVLNQRVAADHLRRGALCILPLEFEVGVAHFALLRQQSAQPPLTLLRLAAALHAQAAGTPSP